MRKPRMLAVGAAVLALTLSACQPGGSGSPSASQSSGSPSTPAELPTVIIGSADFDEAAVVAEIYAQALEAAGFTVERNLYTGPRETTVPALENGDLNLMPEYIGNLLNIGFGGEATSDPDETFALFDDAAYLEPVSSVDPGRRVEIEAFASRALPGDPQRRVGRPKHEIPLTESRPLRQITVKVSASELAFDRHALADVISGLEGDFPERWLFVRLRRHRVGDDERHDVAGPGPFSLHAAGD